MTKPKKYEKQSDGTWLGMRPVSDTRTSGSTTRSQRVIVEYAAPDWLVMFDDGQIQVVDQPAAALAVIQSAARRGNRTVTITNIEWRHVPAGFVPPTEAI